MHNQFEHCIVWCILHTSCSVQRRINAVYRAAADREQCVSLGKLVFSEKYIKALSVSGERGSEISADGEHLAE